MSLEIECDQEQDTLNFYENTNGLVDDGEITPAESGFMAGYNAAEKNEDDDDEEEEENYVF